MNNTWRMPAEWEPHARTWMAWPCNEGLFGSDGLGAAREAYAEVARRIAEFEPVTMVARPELASDALQLCRHPNIDFLQADQDDSWMRDIGPTFVKDTDGGIAGVDWSFNGWGQVYGTFDADALMARTILQHLSVPQKSSALTTEGGSIHSDGRGNFLICETSILDPQRNPGWSKVEVEVELAKLLGAKSICWLAGGLVDDETRGHVDNLACFTGRDRILSLDPTTSSEVDRFVLERNFQRLSEFRSSDGQRFDIELVPLPKPKLRHNGSWLTRSYINFYIVNGGVIIPCFDDPADEEAAAIICAQFPDRRCVNVCANPILEGGGGVHCITQQQPC